MINYISIRIFIFVLSVHVPPACHYFFCLTVFSSHDQCLQISMFDYFNDHIILSVLYMILFVFVIGFPFHTCVVLAFCWCLSIRCMLGMLVYMSVADHILSVLNLIFFVFVIGFRFDTCVVLAALSCFLVNVCLHYLSKCCESKFLFFALIIRVIFFLCYQMYPWYACRCVGEACCWSYPFCPKLDLFCLRYWFSFWYLRGACCSLLFSG